MQEDSPEIRVDRENCQSTGDVHFRVSLPFSGEFDERHGEELCLIHFFPEYFLVAMSKGLGNGAYYI